LKMTDEPTKSSSWHDRPLVAWFDFSRYVFFGAETICPPPPLQSKTTTPFAAHDSGSRAGFSPDGNMLYSGGYDGRLSRRRPTKTAVRRVIQPTTAGSAPSPSVPAETKSPPAATTTSSSSGTPPMASWSPSSLATPHTYITSPSIQPPRH
jgi:hypothetical protein